MTLPFWDERFAGDDYVYGTAPNAFLAGQAHLLRPGMRALAVADGEGRNGVWLAERGLAVLSVDGSAIGQEKTRRLAAARGVAVETLCADLLAWDWPHAAFDLVAAIFIHFGPTERPRMHHAMLEALKPGGLLVMEVFHPDQARYRTGGPPDPAMLYSAETLRRDFVGAHISLLEERVASLEEGRYHRGPAAVTRLMARRPPQSDGAA
jgi:cyclopropane fatty-acyl-phospholipid synthase-like methyltransferase